MLSPGGLDVSNFVSRQYLIKKTSSGFIVARQTQKSGENVGGKNDLP